MRAVCSCLESLTLTLQWNSVLRTTSKITALEDWVLIVLDVYRVCSQKSLTFMINGFAH